MNKILPFILTTVIGFAVGVGAGVWIGRTPTIDAPPAGILDEVKDAPIGSNNTAPAINTPRDEAYRQIRAEMEDFRKEIVEMKNSLRDQMDPILTPEQREHVSRWRERPPPPPQPAGTPPPARGRSRLWEGFDSALSIMMVPVTLERLDQSLEFTPGQKAAIHKLLLERRAKFLELVDTTPPPSFKVLKLAPPEAKVKPSK
ncbi:hypothetical protein M2447_002718 [Ereboglobus sp. PH5-10]|uniref:hypothetical protein n=1 Tax=Ereboglobus sp. PH5-10 TaxID=2940629 RepID=UPI0024057FF1|nr:hypothetical protein [Ereboglobus sp. PH5-10]MDF9828592.1 hypothetical protein [Ereboglobus sp. PH5-10]